MADSVKLPALPFVLPPTRAPGFFFLFGNVVVGILTTALAPLIVVDIVERF